MVSALGGSRTPNLLIRSQMLYPLSYERSWCGLESLCRSSWLPQGGLEVVSAGVLDVGNVGLERGVVLDDARRRRQFVRRSHDCGDHSAPRRNALAQWM